MMLQVMLPEIEELTLYIPMDSSIKFGTIKSGWSILYIEGHRL